MNKPDYYKVKITKAYTVVDTHDYYTCEVIGYRFDLLDAEALRHFEVEWHYFYRYGTPGDLMRSWNNEMSYYEIEEIEII